MCVGGRGGSVVGNNSAFCISHLKYKNCWCPIGHRIQFTSDHQRILPLFLNFPLLCLPVIPFKFLEMLHLYISLFQCYDLERQLPVCQFKSVNFCEDRQFQGGSSGEWVLGTQDFKWAGWSNGGKNQTQKNPGVSNKTHQKSNKINRKKIPCWNSQP